MEKLLDMLDDNEDVQNTYHNWDRTKPLANADFFSSVIPAVVTYLCPAMAYTAASVVTYIMSK